jgi:hypothetical protein
MSKVVTPITATVELITAEKQGQYGPYRSVLFLDESKTGEDAKIWKSFDPDSEELILLVKGLKVQLVPTVDRNGKTSHNIVLLGDIPTPQQMLQSSRKLWTNEQKRQMADRAQQQLQFMEFCLKETRQKFPALSDEAIAVLACKLFDSARGRDVVD